MNYYNENDRFAAEWLRNLIKHGVIPMGDVDERSIKDVEPKDLKGYTQCYFFAGIGGWAEALRIAGWPSDRPVWTGSCPCQPLSVAGLGKGAEDERHLWPVFASLILESRPPVVFGEQVASADGRKWFSGVRLDLEAMGYAVGAADLCAAGLGAPHIRQRLWWVADTDSGRHTTSRRSQTGTNQDDETRRKNPAGVSGNPCDSSGLDADGSKGCGVAKSQSQRKRGVAFSNRGKLSEPDRKNGLPLKPGGMCGDGGVGNTKQPGRQRLQRSQNMELQGKARAIRSTSTASLPDFWNNYELVPCLDGKARRIEPSSSPLVDGLPNRVGLLRGYGNAIVPQVGAEFIKAFMEE